MEFIALWNSLYPWSSPAVGKGWCSSLHGGVSGMKYEFKNLVPGGREGKLVFQSLIWLIQATHLIMMKEICNCRNYNARFLISLNIWTEFCWNPSDHEECVVSVTLISGEKPRPSWLVFSNYFCAFEQAEIPFSSNGYICGVLHLWCIDDDDLWFDVIPPLWWLTLK